MRFLLTSVILGATISAGTASTALASKDTIVFGRGGDSVTLDPAAATDGESFNVTDHIYNNLVKMKPGTTDIIPDLAEKWDISKDGLTYTFHLHKGAKFHDGTPVNADAVVFSLMRQKDPKHEAHDWSGPYSYFYALNLPKLIKKIEAVTPHTVRFTLSEPNATFLSCLGMQAFAVVSPTALRKYKKDFGRNPVGSGPFVFGRWKEKELIVLRRNDDYWGKKPEFKTLIFRSIPDNNSRMMELMAQNIHVMDNPAPADVTTIKKRMGDKVNVITAPGFNVAYLALNNEKPPFDNPKVRQAIAHAINKEALIKLIYHGLGQTAKNPMPPTLWGYNDDIKDYEYSVKKALELLKEAGMEKGFETTIWAMPVPRPYMPDGRKVAESIQGDLAKVGIKAKIVSYDWGTYLQKTQQGEHDMALLGWTGDIGDPDNFLYVLLDKDNAVKPAQNISFYKSDELHEVLVKARQETDQKTRVKLYRKAQEIIHRDVPMVPLAHSIEAVPVVSNLKGFTMDPTGRRRFTSAVLK